MAPKGKKVVYEEDFCVKCSECHEMIQATTKAKAALFSLGFSRKNHQSSQGNGAPLAPSGIGNLPGTRQMIITTIDPNKNVQLSCSCHPDAARLLAKLHNVAQQLPSTDCEALGAMNELVDFMGHPTHLVSLDTPTDDVWELTNPILNQALGFGWSPAKLQTLVEQNSVGTMGLCNFIEYLLIEKHSYLLFRLLAPGTLFLIQNKLMGILSLKIVQVKLKMNPFNWTPPVRIRHGAGQNNCRGKCCYWCHPCSSNSRHWKLGINMSLDKKPQVFSQQATWMPLSWMLHLHEVDD
ncbi:hypothetical protein F5887DRAFT_919032 [Amanita rubescens]|nr:hypothetical protein F5887DRAFT_919032 [Amanita rubescens]